MIEPVGKMCHTEPIFYFEEVRMFVFPWHFIFYFILERDREGGKARARVSTVGRGTGSGREKV